MVLCMSWLRRAVEHCHAAHPSLLPDFCRVGDCSLPGPDWLPAASAAPAMWTSDQRHRWRVQPLQPSSDSASTAPISSSPAHLS